MFPSDTIGSFFGTIRIDELLVKGVNEENSKIVSEQMSLLNFVFEQSSFFSTESFLDGSKCFYFFQSNKTSKKHDIC